MKIVILIIWSLNLSPPNSDGEPYFYPRIVESVDQCTIDRIEWGELSANHRSACYEIELPIIPPALDKTE